MVSTALERIKKLNLDGIGIAVAAGVEALYESKVLDQIPDVPRWMVIVFVLAAALRLRWRKTDGQ